MHTMIGALGLKKKDLVNIKLVNNDTVAEVRLNGRGHNYVREEFGCSVVANGKRGGMRSCEDHGLYD